jgi:hypothetical protein
MKKSLLTRCATLYLIDGFPIRKFARAHFSHVFKGEVAYGYCAAKKERY